MLQASGDHVHLTCADAVSVLILGDSHTFCPLASVWSSGKVPERRETRGGQCASPGLCLEGKGEVGSPRAMRSWRCPFGKLEEGTTGSSRLDSEVPMLITTS